jgi:amino acid adenylation domain-containing protein/non-ribosomal peptide synthase protein (TIGR01720 family)
MTDSYPLSPMQQGMLFHHLREPHSGVDVEQLVIHLPEVIEIPQLQSAWQWLVQRHDVLRAQFVWDDVEQPLQEVVSNVVVPVLLEDASGLDTVARAERLHAFLTEDRIRGFDLSRAPLLRLTLFRWEAASCSLVWSFHHALLDGRTFATLLREVFEAYEELRMGVAPERAAPPCYRTYIDWLQQQTFDEAETFWKQALAGFRAPTPLVVDRQLPASVAIDRQGEAWGHLGAAVTARLRALAGEHDLTVNTIVMGAWAILLHRYSGEEDVLFGATRACRKSSVPEADETIGLFINTVPVRVAVNSEEPALAILTRVRQQWLNVRPYEHTPLARVKAVSQVPPAQPLFETLVVFENYRLDTVMRSLGGAWARRSVELHERTDVPITLAAYDGEELSFKSEFDRRRLDDHAVGRLLGHLRSVLESLAANPQSSVADLRLVSDAERRELIDAFNEPAHAPAHGGLPLDGSATLHSLFEAQVARTPKARALTFDEHSLTYEQLNKKANRLARHLTECGVGPDTLVGLYVERSNELVIAILGILKAGGAYLPIDLTYPADRVAFMLEDAQAPVLLTERRLIGDLPATRASVVFVEEVLEHGGHAGDDENLLSVAGPDHMAYVIYTSGTTGTPKGSVITHRNVVRLFSSTVHWYGFGEQDVWTLFHSCAFDFSVWEIWGALLYGGRVVVVPFLVSRSPEAFYELVAREQVTFLNQTPSAFRQLIQAEDSIGQKDLALRFVIFGGEALEMQSLKPWFDRHGDERPVLVNMYGITETTVHVTYRPLTKLDVRSSSVIGVPIPDLQIYILDSHRQPVPVGVPGEIYVGGAGLAREYLRRPELTAQRFVPDTVTGHPDARLYRTGDLARFLQGYDIEYLGRIDHQVKIRGFRIELGEIESVLCQHPAILEAVVMAREDVPGAKRLVAYVVTPQPAPEVSALREHLKAKVPEYMVPAAFVILDELPLTSHGKVNRKALPIPEQQRPELAGHYVAPRTDVEQRLARIWSKVLRIDLVGVHDNFFELGGDSILSIQIISLARRERLQLTPKLLFDNQTIAELSLVAVTTAGVSSAPAALVSGDVPLTPIQSWFFEQNLEEAQHYNQAFMFEVVAPLARPLLERALVELGRHHDALRLRYVRAGGGWRQFYSAPDEVAPLTWVDLSDVSDGEQQRSIGEAANLAQASFSLENGPVWRAAYFDRGRGRPGYLLLAVHHLAVDGISWRPLIEDLETAYQQLEAGQAVRLPAKDTSFKAWAEHLQKYADADSLQRELEYWREISEPRREAGREGQAEGDEMALNHAAVAQNTEGSCRTIKVALTVSETQALLQQVPAAYNTQINDALLTALARAWHQWNGSRVLFTNLEGHGREHLFDDVDLSRTVGWFTTIFPVRLELPRSAEVWQPGIALKEIKEQLRQVPRHGIGYGILRYLSAHGELSACPEPSTVFNYLGQFDHVVAGSKLFRFASESTGPWHSPRQRRRHTIELNSLVINGRLELWCTYSEALHAEASIQKLADQFQIALKQLVAHCLSPDAGGRTPSDFPLARLDQAGLDDLVGGRRDIEDVYPLSPIQSLFYSAAPGAVSLVFDQWQGTLEGQLNVPAFQAAWRQTLHRHTVLRSTIHADGLPTALQVVHRDAELPWAFEDWRGVPATDQGERWRTFLDEDRVTPLNLTATPIMRFALIRLTDDRWKFVWSVPALLLDGWSWPLVFRDASRLYEALSEGKDAQLAPVRPYRDYLEWLARQSSDEASRFWRTQLAGFIEPTPVPSAVPDGVAAGERYARHSIKFSPESTESLQGAARAMHLTVNTLVQGAWALLLNHHTGAPDLVFGAAFSGRPTDLPGAESIVGPFVNNLPVRITVNENSTVGTFLQTLHARLLELSSYQFTPLMEIQRLSEVPWRYRLFETVVVFQNYLVDESARSFGGHVGITDFVGPIHTNYPVMLLAEPGPSLRLTLIHDQQKVARTDVERWGRDLALLMEGMPACSNTPIRELQALLSPPTPVVGRPRPRIGIDSQNYVPPQSAMEKTIATVWQGMFGLERVGVEENFFDLGGHSLLLVQMHNRLRTALKTEFSIVTLFEHPTVRSLARHLEEPAVSAVDTREQWRHRAERQKQALAKMRSRLQRDPK